MTTFDTPGTGREGTPDPTVVRPDSPAEPPAARISPLDQLVAEVQDRESEEDELLGVEVPGLGVRLMCSTNIDGDDWQAWQRQSIPRAKRRKAGALDLNQMTLMCLVLENQCEHLEYRTGDGWAAMPGSGGEPLDLRSDELLRRFKQMDSTSLLRKLFARDADLLAAGQEVVDKAGWGDPDAVGDDSDPTER
jgi:hypothetical protein